MYKDKDRQREANRKAAREYRENQRNALKGMTNEGMTMAPKNVIPVIPSCDTPDVIPKRGKDIKTFEDLPPDVQASIRNISDTNEEFQRRVGIAIRYQHLFPDRYNSTGVAI